MSEWISVKDALPDSGRVLAAYLEPFFGDFVYEFGVCYYDNPDDYKNPENGQGWMFWVSDKKVIGGGVTHWMPLPAAPKDKL